MRQKRYEIEKLEKRLGNREHRADWLCGAANWCDDHTLFRCGLAALLSAAVTFMLSDTLQTLHDFIPFTASRSVTLAVVFALFGMLAFATFYVVISGCAQALAMAFIRLRENRSAKAFMENLLSTYKDD